MASSSCSLKPGISVSGFIEKTIVKPKTTKQFPQNYDFKTTQQQFPDLICQFLGQSLVVSDQKNLPISTTKFSVKAQTSYCVSKAMRWWEKTLKPNMIEIHSAQHLVDELKNAADNLVIVDFYSPGCGGCKSLHPKICQLAESNPDAIFLKVNYEELKPMCHALNIHVLPFFRFYRGAEGRVCSFSCTISTIKKFKDALAKHNTERSCTLVEAKGLEESEMTKLASMGQLSLDSRVPTLIKDGLLEELMLEKMDFSNAKNVTANNAMLVS
ncbi:thioredoxin-like 1-2, chloroplastic [Chenopodium quinoa]|uniref:Thioredoxin domain-containing protein n=1 Tax=Chenopodium quinoa TaxID=63459 RepID=A0A803L995_CHEQI|nr:thioredoxin-like 1-2, chloroplastic [Chenopodium quinoa]